MANVQKLVYIGKNLNSSKKWLKDNSNDKEWNNSSNDFYRSLVFTGDGHLLTHGLDFSSAASYGLGLIYNSTAGNTTSAKPLSTDGASIPVLTNNADTTISVTWTKLTDLVTENELSNWTGSTKITTLGTIGTGKWNGTKIDVQYGGTGKDSLAVGEVLIGNGTDAVETKKIDSTVTENSSNLITSGAVKTAIDDILGASNAMVFKGVLIVGDTLDKSAYSAGWTYRVNEAGWITSAGKLVSTKPSGSSIHVEVGDLIIAISDATTSQSSQPSYQSSHWTVAQANIDGAVTASDVLTNNTLILGADGQAIKSLANGSNDQYLAIRSSSPTWASFQSLTIQDTKDTPTSLTYNPSAAKTLVFTGSTTISGTSDDTITVTTTNNKYSLITATANNSTSYNSSGTGKYINLLTQANGGAFSAVSHIQLATTGDATITLADQKITIGSTPYTAADGLDLSNHVFSLNVLGENETLSGNGVTGKAYAVALDDNGVPYVNVPWTDTNTWRPVNAYQLASQGATSTTAAKIWDSGIRTNSLCFGSEFVAINIDNNSNMDGSEIHLVWAEVDDEGIKYYA